MDANPSDFSPVRAPWRPVPFGNALMGHAVVDLIGAILTALLVFLANYFGVAPGDMHWDSMWMGIAGGWLTAAVLATLIERAFVVKHQHDDPGSWPKTALVTLASVPAGMVCFLISGKTGSTWLLAILGAHFIGYGVEHIAILQQWRDGMTRPEVREAWEETKKLTHDTFGE